MPSDFLPADTVVSSFGIYFFEDPASKRLLAVKIYDSEKHSVP